ncbi:uncharacterized protein LOC121739079 [Aricia agestis]|uniref:uncharacterized protein LOC121739079 n=1 Tax=Aricia agestis TaxID=91739 RepID=UPI001C201C67|nr:uncharacterized protein LOC121739079 [Aricia agestis]
MVFIIFAIFLSFLQNGLAQYPAQFYIQPEIVERRIPAPVFIPETPITQMKFPNPTTIITDCTPSVCHNLGNLVQLMIVSNLLQNTNIGSPAAIKIALPIIKEVLSSPSLANICPESLKQKFNMIASRLPVANTVANISPNIAVPNLEVSPNLFIANDLWRAAPNLNSPNIIYQNLPVNNNIPGNTILQDLVLQELFETKPVQSLPYIPYQNLPLPVETISNTLPLNVALQNIVPLPFNIHETKAVPNSLPLTIIYQDLPLSVNTNNVPINTVLQNVPVDSPQRNIEGLPFKIVFKSSPNERVDYTPNVVSRNTPRSNLNTISSSFPLSISSPNTKPVIKFLLRS